MKKFILLSAILLLYACASSKKTGDKWIGDSERNIIKTWGPPVRIINNGDQGEILVYAEQIFTNDNNDQGSKIAGPNYWDYIYVYANKDGKIYSYKNDRQQLPPQAIAVK